ncbi:flagellar hook-basal body complex protein FliE [Alteromonadaceae bacterium BrNp21-10]|nr:flagellar hook-basal body complex protein FliE [Alteromonadaceae bacterium BrNp21-10]
MDIKAQSLYSELQALSAQAQMGISDQAVMPANPSSQNFGDMLSQAINNVNSMQLDSKDQARAFEMGDKSLSLADVMIAKEKAGIAFDATVQVRNKVVEAYKQMMNMPV